MGGTSKTYQAKSNSPEDLSRRSLLTAENGSAVKKAELWRKRRTGLRGRLWGWVRNLSTLRKKERIGTRGDRKDGQILKGGRGGAGTL